MPINVFGSSSSAYDNGNETDTSLFLQKPNLITIYIESNYEEDIDLKNRYRIKSLPDPISIREACGKNYVNIFIDNIFNDPSIIKNTAHVDFNDKNLGNVHSIKVNSFPSLEEHLTPKIYVNQAISKIVDESLVNLDPDEKLKIDEQDSIVPNSSLTLPKTLIELPTKSYVDSRLMIPVLLETTLMLTSVLKISITLDSLK